MDAVESRLAALENKMKASFLEAEKRLGRLETERAESAEGAVEERVQEIEDLLLLVQLENTKIKENLGTGADVVSSGAVPENVESKLSELESEIESLKQGHVTTESLPSQNVPSQNDIESRLSEIEKKLSSPVSEEAAQGGDDSYGIMEKRIEMLEKAMSSAKPAAPLKEIEGRMQQLREELMSEFAKSGKASPKEIQDYLGKITAERSALMKDFQALSSLRQELENASKTVQKIPQIEAVVEKMDSYLTKIQTSEERLRAESMKIESGREALQGLLESRKAAEKEAQEYLNKIMDERKELARDFESLSSIKGELAEAMKSRKELMQKISEAEVNAEKADAYFTRMRTFEEKIHANVSKIESIRDGIDSKLKSYIDAAESVKAEMENRIRISDEKIKPRLEKLDMMKESFETKQGNLEIELEGVKSLGKQFRELSKIPSIESSLSALGKRMQDIGNLHGDYDDESVRIASIERELSRMRAGEEAIKPVNDRFPITQEPGRNYGEEGAGLIEKEMLDLQSLKQELEEEKTSRISLEKRLEDAAGKMPSISEKPMPADDIARLKADIVSQKQTINEMEKRLEKQAIKFFAENLEEFAHALEKRFPRLIREEQYYKDMHAIEQKLKSIAAPDMSPLAARVELLEQHISEIQRMMKSVSSRVPMVVE